MGMYTPLIWIRGKARDKVEKRVSGDWVWIRPAGFLGGKLENTDTIS
jgi:hypothetical protein